MNQRKTNNSLWYSLGLAVLLCVAFLVVATGTTLARYRSEREAEITFAVREPERVCLGTVKTITAEEATDALSEGTVVFDASMQPAWKTVENVPQLQLAVANGASATEYSIADQKIRLRLIAGLGVWTGETPANFYLILPAEDASAETKKIQGTATVIEEGTSLYQIHGAGWVYTFQDENGEELSWILEGGKLSYISLTVTMEGAELSEPSLLQHVIIADMVSE